MKFKFKIIILKLLFLYTFAFFNFSYADNHNIYETLEIIKNDLKTLERAVYSGSIDVSQTTGENLNIELDSNWRSYGWVCFIIQQLEVIIGK